jgi:nicotinate phosphoribosyltransferase
MKSNDYRTMEGALYTDEYQLTMAQLYFRMGLHEINSQFDHFFRSYPNYDTHRAGYCINAGLEWFLDWLNDAHFRDEDIEYLRHQKGSTGRQIFREDFLQWLRKNGTFDGITLRSIPEGRVVHPNVPVNVVQGPLYMAQIIETPLLNQLNYQILIATKASRIFSSGRGQMLLEFGLRRAQDKGANAGARAAMIGGAAFTSNVGISHVLGYPPKGTHAHSMVQVFMAMGEGELEAFRAYAEIYPDDCLLLVDTIDTLESGIPNAIKVFEELRKQGHKPVGIRLDSGDLAYLSIQAAKMMDDAGFPDTKIVLSNELDEMVIWQILSQIEEESHYYGIEADHLINRLVYGVGTRLITSAGKAALDGVYKLTAIEQESKWIPAIKISESPEKTPLPGHKLAWRIYDQRGRATADLLSLDDEDPCAMDEVVLHHPVAYSTYRSLHREEISDFESLMVDVLRDGELVYDLPDMEKMRSERKADLDRLDPGVKRILNPHIYHVSVTQRLWDLKEKLIHSVNNDE